MRFGGIWQLTVLWLGAYAFWRFQGGFVSGFLFYTMTVLAVYVGLVWLTASAGWSVECVIESRSWTKGDCMMVQVRICRRLPLPFVWIQGEPVLPRRLWSAYRPDDMFRLLWFRRHVCLTYRLEPLPRGKYVVPDMELICGDLWGLVRHRRRFPQSQSFVVYPRWRPLRPWLPATGTLFFKQGTVLRSARKPADDVTVAGIRDWQPGDRLHQIHWKASARGSGWKTKRTEADGSSPVVLLLDVCRASYREPESPLLERGVEMALSLAQAAVTAGLAVGLWAAGRQPICIDPLGEAHSLQRVAHALVLVEADGTTPVSALLRPPLWHGWDDAELVIITPELGPDLAEAIRYRLHSRRPAAIRVVWLADGGTGVHPGQALLQQLGVPVYRAADDEWPAGFGAVSQRRGDVHGFS